MIGPIEEDLREKLFTALSGREEINSDFWQGIGHSIKHGVLGITDPCFQRRVHTTPTRQLVENW